MHCSAILISLQCNQNSTAMRGLFYFSIVCKNEEGRPVTGGPFFQG